MASTLFSLRNGAVAAAAAVALGSLLMSANMARQNHEAQQALAAAAAKPAPAAVAKAPAPAAPAPVVAQARPAQTITTILQSDVDTTSTGSTAKVAPVKKLHKKPHPKPAAD